MAWEDISLLLLNAKIHDAANIAIHVDVTTALAGLRDVAINMEKMGIFEIYDQWLLGALVIELQDQEEVFHDTFRELYQRAIDWFYFKYDDAAISSTWNRDRWKDHKIEVKVNWGVGEKT